MSLATYVVSNHKYEQWMVSQRNHLIQTSIKDSTTYMAVEDNQIQLDHGVRYYPLCDAFQLLTKFEVILRTQIHVSPQMGFLSLKFKCTVSASSLNKYIKGIQPYRSLPKSQEWPGCSQNPKLSLYWILSKCLINITRDHWRSVQIVDFLHMWCGLSVWTCFKLKKKKKWCLAFICSMMMVLWD